MPTDPRVRLAGLQVADIQLPSDVDDLYDLAYNLWWTWSPAARRLFSSIDGAAWAMYRNPVELLLNVDRDHWEALVGNEGFMSDYSAVIREFEAYLSPTADTWFSRRRPGYDGGPIAYFSMEFGIHQTLAIYSGGLGVLSGDHAKSASDLGLPFVGVGLLYRNGYFRQTVDAEGYQQHSYPELDFHRLPLRPALDSRGREVRVRVTLGEHEVAVGAWLAEVGRVPLLLLDTDLPENDPADRPITNVLYVRGREMRLVQEIVLGVGGAKVLEALDLEPAVWHINEGHSALLQLERMRGIIAARDVSLEEAVGIASRSVVFTTHTPVEAGNESFDRDLARPYVEPFAPLLGADVETLLDLGRADHGAPHQPLNLTALALRTSRFANGVSELHARVSSDMWRHLFDDRGELPVRPITNGVHHPTWLGLEMRDLLRKHLGDGWLEAQLEEKGWDGVMEISDEELWSVHLAQKARLMRFSRSRLMEQSARHGHPPGELREVSRLFEDEALTVGFARRFATYKRAGLLFSDLHRLRLLLRNRERPVRVFLAGKAHPADQPGKDLVRHLFMLSQEADLKGHVVFLENYDMRIGRMLVQGVDVWLNTPRRPLEASGTSGQKAAANGVLNCSVLDGWWPEAYDGSNGWAIGTDTDAAEEWRADEEDARSLYGLFEDSIVPTYYERDESGLPRRWIQMMKSAIASVGPRFSAARMVRDYAEKAYLPLADEDPQG